MFRPSTAPFAYVVYKKAATYFADATVAGMRNYANTDAQTVIQNAINAMAHGQKIFFKQGTYELTSGLTIDKNIALAGENPIGTTLKAVPPTPPLATLIDISDTATYVFFINLQIDGDQKATTVLDASKASPSDLPVFFYGCNIHGATSKNLNISNRGGCSLIDTKVGLDVSPSDYNLYFDGLSSTALEVRINHCALAFAKVAAIYADNYKYLNIVNSILGCDDGAYHIQVENYATAKIVNTWFENWKAYAVYNSGTAAGRITSHGARYAGQIKGTFQWVSLNGDSFIYDTGTFATPLNLTVTNSLTGNVWFETTTTSVSITGKYHFFDTKSGKWFSNLISRGNVTMPNGQYQVTVYHGLAGIPDIVLLTGRDDEVADLVVSTKYADRFDIQTKGDAPVSADRVIDWYAEYIP